MLDFNKEGCLLSVYTTHHLRYLVIKKNRKNIEFDSLFHIIDNNFTYSFEQSLFTTIRFIGFIYTVFNINLIDLISAFINKILYINCIISFGPDHF